MIFDLPSRAKPALKWAGGKSALLPQLASHFPAGCKVYIEPFLGGGAVFLALGSGTVSLINDSNPEIFNLYSIIRDQPQALMTELDKFKPQYSENFYYSLRQSKPETCLQQAARTIFLNKTGFNGLYRQNASGQFNVPFGKRLTCPALYQTTNILAISSRLQSADLKNQDFEEILEEAQEGDLVYCDPPYEPLDQTSSFTAYQARGFSQVDQIRLKEACLRAHSRGALVFISNSSADFILDLYAGFEIQKIRARRAINSDGGKRGEVEEVLVCLVPSPKPPLRKSGKRP